MTSEVVSNGVIQHGEEPPLRLLYSSKEESEQRTIVLKFGGTVCGRLPKEVTDICLYGSPRDAVARSQV